MFSVGDGTPVGDAQDDCLRLRAQETLQHVHWSPSWGRRSRTSCSTRVTAARRSRSILRTACTTRFVMAFTMSKSSRSQHVGPNQVAAALCLVTNTGDRGYRPRAGNAQSSRSSSRPATGRGLPRCPFRQPRPGSARRSSTPGASGIFWLSQHIFSSPPRSSRSSHRDPATLVVRLRVACLLQFDNLTRCLLRATHSHRETQGSPDSVFAVCDGFGAVQAQAGRDPTPRAPQGCAGSTAPRTCLSAAAPSTTLSHFGCRKVPTWSLASTLGHTSWCNLLTWYSEHKYQPLSRKCFTRDTWHLFVLQQPTRCLPHRHALHHARARPRGDPVTGAVRVEGHVLRREPASHPHGRPGETAVPALSVLFQSFAGMSQR